MATARHTEQHGGQNGSRGQLKFEIFKLGIESSETARTHPETVRNRPKPSENDPKTKRKRPKPSETVRNRPKTVQKRSETVRNLTYNILIDFSVPSVREIFYEAPLRPKNKTFVAALLFPGLEIRSPDDKPDMWLSSGAPDDATIHHATEILSSGTHVSSSQEPKVVKSFLAESHDQK